MRDKDLTAAREAEEAALLARAEAETLLSRAVEEEAAMLKAGPGLGLGLGLGLEP